MSPAWAVSCACQLIPCIKKARPCCLQACRRSRSLPVKQGTRYCVASSSNPPKKGMKKCQRLLSIMSTFIFNGVYWSLRSTVVCLCVSQHRGRRQAPRWGVCAAFLKMHNVLHRKNWVPPSRATSCPMSQCIWGNMDTTSWKLQVLGLTAG